jgi:hypothetical protein
MLVIELNTFLVSALTVYKLTDGGHSVALATTGDEIENKGITVTKTEVNK